MSKAVSKKAHEGSGQLPRLYKKEREPSVQGNRKNKNSGREGLGMRQHSG